jgi:hypothetical protein
MWAALAQGAGCFDTVDDPNDDSLLLLPTDERPVTPLSRRDDATGGRESTTSVPPPPTASFMSEGDTDLSRDNDDDASTCVIYDACLAKGSAMKPLNEVTGRVEVRRRIKIRNM